MSKVSHKHFAPYRPVDSLSVPHKPCFETLKQASEDSFCCDNDSASVGHLGNSSSLFDEDSALSIDNTQPFNSVCNPPTQQYRTISHINNMVREREPPSNPPPSRGVALGQAPAHPPIFPPRPLQELQNPAPQFGQTSPLRNPLKPDRPKDNYAHLFNKPRPGQRRPEHFQATGISSQPPPPYAPSRPTVPGREAADPGNVLSKPFQVPQPNASSQNSTASPASSDFTEIPASYFQPRQSSHGIPLAVPHNPPSQTTFPPPRPMFSSLQPNGFQAVNTGTHNPLQQARKTVILDDEDDFDPDAAIRANGDYFGAPDMDAYVDSGKASENIKALLEGAFDDENEKLPRTRGRKKKKKQEEERVTNSLADRLHALQVKEDEDKAKIEEEGDDEDDGTVDGLKVKLLPHQVDGVSWMIEKETGAHNKRAKLPKGGILADDMGLGKTVQSIALILSNPRPEKGVEPENKKNKILDSTGKGTLVVAPLALIKQWEAEINSKVTKSHALKVLVHHGASRTKSADKLKEYDIVITTYQVLASEHASCGDGPDGLKKGCFGVHWYRTMLDEAHTIKNRNAKMTKACYEVRSHYRWCLTGTPMQNNLDELQSLVKFLRIQPYCEMANWRDSISGPMKNGRGNLAMRRLQIFLKAFMKRRTKDVLKKEGALTFGGKAKDGEEKGGFQIVERNVEIVVGEFTAKERKFYDRLSDRAQLRLDEMMGGEKQDYIGALVLLLRLRQACNHPNLTKSNVKDDKDALATGSQSGTQAGLQTPRKAMRDADADDLADLLGGLSVQTKRCDTCQTTLTRNNAEAGATRCTECEEDLNASTKRTKKTKKKHHEHHKHKGNKTKKHRHVVSDDEDDEEQDQRASQTRKSARQRPVIVDSDDEEGAEWLVSEDQQHIEDKGQVGGTDDENAEGGGDTLASVDSEASDTADESRSNLDSFIVHDTDSEEESVLRKKVIDKAPRISKQRCDDEDSSSAIDSESDSEEDSEASNSTTEASDIEYTASALVPSTKIRQLLLILEKETPEHKVIVFSQFTSMLDLIEPFLKREGYNFTRYDGLMRNDLREASLHRLRNDKRTRVLLCSLKCGSLGLNLTAASRVVIMEPFWNPFVEEQAIDRVHRLNQTVNVTVYRLSIHNSVEAHILELQERKRALAAAALEGGAAIGKLSMKDILALFKRDAEYDANHVDQGEDRVVFERTRVLHLGREGEGEVVKGPVGRMEGPGRGRKAGSLGLGIGKGRGEDTVYGRR